ncbi:MAG: CopG family transcriptional regulator [Deltaproteobacteria bacterium]|nr:CopG family transcriptional regulator [Deltaproteobacteria bacterium]
MIRTQISLEPEEYSWAKKEARRLGLSLAELLRRSLRHLLPAKTGKPWMRFAGLVSSGDSEASQKIDELIYGHKD